MAPKSISKFQEYQEFYRYLSRVKGFFIEKNFQEILCPPLTTEPTMEEHVHPLSVHSQHHQNLFLSTSPEFHLKSLLNTGYEKIYSLNFSFRDDPLSPLHRPQFLMLEWYQVGQTLTEMMTTTENLVCSLQPNCKFSRRSVDECFIRYCGFSILDHLNKESLYEKILETKVLTQIPKNLEWDDYFFLLFLNLIEPELKKIPGLILYDYPAPLAALAQISQHDSRTCQRFEMYLNGIEVCNAYQECVNSEEILRRAEKNLYLKEKNYGVKLPIPHSFINNTRHLAPLISGNALGIERMFQVLYNKNEFFLS